MASFDKNRLGLAAFLLLLAGLFIFLGGSALFALKTASELRAAGTTTNGVVTAKLANNSGRSYDLEVRYRFTVDGREFSNTYRVSQAVFNKTHEGQDVSIHYLPRNPQISGFAIAGEIGRQLGRTIVCIIISLLLVFGSWSVYYQPTFLGSLKQRVRAV